MTRNIRFVIGMAVSRQGYPIQLPINYLIKKIYIFFCCILIMAVYSSRVCLLII